MPNQILLATSGLTLVFVSAAATILGFSIVAGKIRNVPEPVDGRQAARHLIYQQFPLEAGIANAAMMFAAFLLLLPGLLTPTRGLLKAANFAISVCAVFTLCLGIFLWLLTLNTKATFAPIWRGQSQDVQGLMENTVSGGRVVFCLPRRVLFFDVMPSIVCVWPKMLRN
jgi:hypothetical protein